MLLPLFLSLSIFAQETEMRLPTPQAEKAPAISEPAPESTAAPILVDGDLEKQDGPALLAPASRTLVDEEVIRGLQPQSMDDVLKNEPGIEFAGGPRTSAELPQIRGMNSDRILILQDGVRQNFQSGHNGRVFLDSDMVDSVEVVKGPWSSLYGGGALGGVISITRPTARDYLDRTGLESGVRLSGQGSTVAEAGGGRLTAFGQGDGFEPLISVKKSVSQDLRTGRGGSRLEYSAGQTDDAYGSLGYEFSPGHRVTVKAGRFAEQSEQPLNPNQQTVTRATTAVYNIRKENAVIDYRLKRDANIDLHVRPSLSRTTVEKIRRSDERTDEQAVQTTGLDAWNNFSSKLGETAEVTTTVGAEVFEDLQEGARNGGDLNTFADARAVQVGAYVQPSFVFDKRTKVTPGLRFDRYDLTAERASNITNGASQVSGKLYASHEYAPGRTVFAGYGQGFNPPKLQDLYATGVHFPGNTFVPNPDLRPERSQSYEAGLKNRIVQDDGSAIEADLTAFYTEASDFIVRDVGPVTTRFANVDRARLSGAEARTFYRAFQFGGGLSYGQTRSRNLTTENPLEDTPANKWTARLESYLNDRVTVGADLRYYEAQNDVADGAPTTPSAFVQDVSLQYSNPYNKGFSAALRVNNLSDLLYRKHGSTLDEAGRDLRVDLSWLM